MRRSVSFAIMALAFGSCVSDPNTGGIFWSERKHDEHMRHLESELGREESRESVERTQQVELRRDLERERIENSKSATTVSDTDAKVRALRVQRQELDATLANLNLQIRRDNGEVSRLRIERERILKEIRQIDVDISELNRPSE